VSDFPADPTYAPGSYNIGNPLVSPAEYEPAGGDPTELPSPGFRQIGEQFLDSMGDQPTD
jgi:hypothetical protein